MKASSVRSLLILTLLIISSAKVFATCGDTQNQRSPETDSFHCFEAVTPITKAVHWKISWLDGYDRDVDVIDQGQLGGDSFLFGCSPVCWPSFEAPYFDDNGTTAIGFKEPAQPR
ncbi:MAG: hypothetical protein QOF72_2404 [Blastocatellia bacterium]|jgi:hypothetical protein|nr:hypothetical protein [Blastocatellia bacterium]